jgi:hypothetical protein
MTEPRPPADLPPRPGGTRASLALNLLELVWVLGTPALFGPGIRLGVRWPDGPRWLLWGAVACAVLAPAAGLALAVANRRRARAVVLAIALAIGVPFAGAIWLWVPD